ncbi:MAG TPA: Mpo1-like protein [Roseateles sp.]|uniref:Mpo1-like protein n=1 Tax=Roseateles sp. TaxID=1971397 RepID=UPI002EDAAC96
MSNERFTRFADFYPFYLGEHQNKVCRRLHFVGLTLVLVCLWQLFSTGSLVWLLYGLLCGYGFAWVGHFFFEKNRPATFKYPLYSLMGDWAMYRDIWLGRIKL